MPRRCREVREERGFTLQQAACLLNVSEGYLHAVEAGYQHLRWSLAERMARLYRCSEFNLVIPKEESRTSAAR
jgi:transcriptional regulator with XRE-family HTH domain